MGSCCSSFETNVYEVEPNFDDQPCSESDILNSPCISHVRSFSASDYETFDLKRNNSVPLRQDLVMKRSKSVHMKKRKLLIETHRSNSNQNIIYSDYPSVSSNKPSQHHQTHSQDFSSDNSIPNVPFSMIYVSSTSDEKIIQQKIYPQHRRCASDISFLNLPYQGEKYRFLKSRIVRSSESVINEL